MFHTPQCVVILLHDKVLKNGTGCDSVGGIVQPATFVEFRFCEFAPENRAFYGVKKCENGAVRFEVMWVYFINALINHTIHHMKDKNTAIYMQ